LIWIAIAHKRKRRVVHFPIAIKPYELVATQPLLDNMEPWVVREVGTDPMVLAALARLRLPAVDQAGVHPIDDLEVQTIAAPTGRGMYARTAGTLPDPVEWDPVHNMSRFHAL
jgi:hypothetical protein